MDMSTVGNLSSAVNAGNTGDAVGVQVLKKALQIEAETASTLIASVTPGTNNPPNLGNRVDTKA